MNLTIVPVRNVDGARFIVVETHDDHLSQMQGVIAKVLSKSGMDTDPPRLAGHTASLLKLAHDSMTNGSDTYVANVGDQSIGFVPEWYVPTGGDPAYPIHYTHLDWAGIIHDA